MKKKRIGKTTLLCLGIAAVLIVAVVIALPRITALALQKEVGVQKSASIDTPAEKQNETPASDLTTVIYGVGKGKQIEIQSLGTEQDGTLLATVTYEIVKGKQIEVQLLGTEQKEMAGFAVAEFVELFGIDPTASGYLLRLRHTIASGDTPDFWMAQWEPADFEARMLDAQNTKPFDTYTYAFYTDSRVLYFAGAQHFLGNGTPGLYDSFAQGDPTGDAIWKRKEQGEASLSKEEKQLLAQYEAAQAKAQSEHEALYPANQQKALDFVKKAGLQVQEVVYVGGYSGGKTDWGTEVVMKLKSGETITVCVSDITGYVTQFKYGENA